MQSSLTSLFTALTSMATAVTAKFTKDINPQSDFMMALSDTPYRDECMQATMTVMIAPPGLCKLKVIRTFQNHRTTYFDLANQSTRRITNLVSQASHILTQKMLDSNGAKTEGVIILSFLDLFTNHGQYCLANPGTIAKIVRSAATVIDHVLKTSTHKLVIFTPYVHTSKDELARLLWIELELLAALGLDPDISPHLFKRVRLFSILKHCADYTNKDPSSPALDILLKKTSVGLQLSEVGSGFIGRELSATICHWVSKKRIFPPQSELAPYSKEANVIHYFKQISEKNQMVACPEPVLCMVQTKLFPRLRPLFEPEAIPSKRDYIPGEPFSPPKTIPAPQTSGSNDQKMDGKELGSKENGSLGEGCAIPLQSVSPPRKVSVQTLTLQEAGPKPKESFELSPSEVGRGLKENGTPNHHNHATLQDPVATQALGLKNQLSKNPDPVQGTGKIPLAVPNPSMEVSEPSINLANPALSAPQASGVQTQITEKPDPTGKEGKAPQSHPNPTSLIEPDPGVTEKPAPSPQPIPAAQAPKASGSKSRKRKKKPSTVQEKNTLLEPDQSMSGSVSLPKKKKKQNKSRRNQTRSLLSPFHPYPFPGAAGRARSPWVPPPLPYPAYPPYLPPRFY